MKDVHVVINPASGARKTEDIYTNDISPLLQQYEASLNIIEHRTASEGDGIRIGKDIASKSTSKDDTITIILLGGDGTTHEILNGIVGYRNERCFIPCHFNLVLVPTGTANALYASLYPEEKTDSETYKLLNLKAFLSDSEQKHSLALTQVSIDGGESSIAHLITSHALHASILADSEALRSTYPGIERFKVASAQNASIWTPAKVKLQGRGKSERIQLFNPDTSAFEDIDDGKTELEGPFFYFVCVTTDRLESNFVPAPYSGPSSPIPSLQRPSDAVDILIIRPLRDPKLAKYVSRDASFWSDEESKSLRDEFASTRVQAIVGGMYNEGQHVSLRYGGDSGPYMCEYYRCGGYEWTPVSNEAKLTIA